MAHNIPVLSPTACLEEIRGGAQQFHALSLTRGAKRFFLVFSPSGQHRLQKSLIISPKNESQIPLQGKCQIYVFYLTDFETSKFYRVVRGFTIILSDGKNRTKNVCFHASEDP
jgi:hypothetical protein